MLSAHDKPGFYTALLKVPRAKCVLLYRAPQEGDTLPRGQHAFARNRQRCACTWLAALVGACILLRAHKSTSACSCIALLLAAAERVWVRYVQVAGAPCTSVTMWPAGYHHPSSGSLQPSGLDLHHFRHCRFVATTSQWRSR